MKKIYEGPDPGPNSSDLIKTFKKNPNTLIVYRYKKRNPWASPDKVERYDWNEEKCRTAFSLKYNAAQAGPDFDF
ncbi:MAG: hypothetical protein ACFE0S_10205 [Rhodospirillales bacterium]